MKFRIEPGAPWPYVLEQTESRPLYGRWEDAAGTNGRDEYVEISPLAVLYIHEGYAWDGPSGPAIDTMNFAKASLYHDALYQLIRKGLIPARPFRRLADKLMREIAEENGMPAWRRWYAWAAVRMFGWKAVT